MPTKKRIAVLMGGMSAEYEVSMNSGAQIARHLDREAYEVTPIEITRQGEWVFGESGEYLSITDAIAELKNLHPECVFIALHGPYGEDGRMQGLLDLLNIPYTGSGCSASGLAIDKIRAKAVVEHGGIRVPEHEVFTAYDWDRDRDAVRQRIVDTIGLPCVLKNPVQGSSLGMAIPQSKREFNSAVEEIFQFGAMIMAERYLSGVELTCGVLDVDEEQGPYALPVTEIRPAKAAFFDYQAKYTPGATNEITPAEIDDALRDAVQAMAVHAHHLIGCRGFSRSDMIVVDGDIYWLEVNTIPGFTETSLLPQGAEAAGMTFTELVGAIVEAAL